MTPRGSWTLLLLPLLLACGPKEPRAKKVSPAPEPIARAAATAAPDTLGPLIEAYLRHRALLPLLEARRQVMADSLYTIGRHHLACHDTEQGTWIVIDGHRIALGGKVTGNNVSYGEPDSVDLANNWNYARLYRHQGRELLLLSLVFEPCTGLGCSVQYYLLYDVPTGAVTFFGSFNGDEYPALLPWKDRYAFVAEDFSGDPQGATPMTFRRHLFTQSADGHFRAHPDPQGKPYELVTVTHPEDTLLPFSYRLHWFEPLDSARRHFSNIAEALSDTTGYPAWCSPKSGYPFLWGGTDRLSLEFDGQCNYSFSWRRRGAVADLRWDPREDCTHDIGLRTAGAPRPGAVFATLRLANDTTLAVTYRYPAWVRQVNTLNGVVIFPDRFVTTRGR